jgi:hypothetical protein
VRRALRTLLPAAVLVAAVGAAAWGLQAATLPRPTSGQLLAADAARWLTHYTRSTGVERLDGRRAVHSVCVQPWSPPYGTGILRHGAALQLSDGEHLLSFGEHIAVLGPVRWSEPSFEPLVQLELAGCPHLLAGRVAAVLAAHRKVGMWHASVLGRPAIVLRLHTRLSEILLYVTPRKHRPIAVRVNAPNASGFGSFRLARQPEKLVDWVEHAP